MDNQKLVDMTIFQTCSDIRQMILTRNNGVYNESLSNDYNRISSEGYKAIGYALIDLYTMVNIEKPSPYYKDMAMRCINFASEYSYWNMMEIKRLSEERIKEIASNVSSAQPGNN